MVLESGLKHDWYWLPNDDLRISTHAQLERLNEGLGVPAHLWSKCFSKGILTQGLAPPPHLELQIEIADTTKRELFDQVQLSVCVCFELT